MTDEAPLDETPADRFFRLASSGCRHETWDWVDPAKTGIADHWKCLDCGIDTRDGDAFMNENAS